MTRNPLLLRRSLSLSLIYFILLCSSPAAATHRPLPRSESSHDSAAKTFAPLLSNLPTAQDTARGPGAGGALLISAFRLRGPAGALDEFIELYNPASDARTVNTQDGSEGWALAASDGVIRFVIPNGTTIPARGHYLAVNTDYSLSARAPGDISYTADIPDNAGLALFQTAYPANFTFANRLDAVGAASVTDDLYREGAGYPPDAAQASAYSLYRVGRDGTPQDTDDNAADFLFGMRDEQSAGARHNLAGSQPQNLRGDYVPQAQCSALSFNRTDFAVGTNPQTAVVGDFNNDGKSDLATANSNSNDVSILLGTGTGSFSAATNFAAGSGSSSIAVGEFNGDGQSDLAVTNFNANNVSILLGTGTGSFNAPTNFAVGGTAPFSVAISDFNGDGKSDLATANINSANVSVLLGTGTGSFGAATTFTVGTSPAFVAVSDFNADGKNDLAVANISSANVSVLLGTGTGSFGAATNFATGNGPRSIVIADFNSDGKSDLATANSGTNNVSLLLGTGTGSFGVATNFAVGTGPFSVALSDFNGDGKSDLAVANFSSNNVSLLLSTGTGSFGAATNFAVGTAPYSVAASDFNGDGKIDLAAANRTSNDVSLLLNSCIVAPLPVSNTNDSGAGSLRQAILDANGTTGVQTINLSIGSGLQTINLLSPLPTITDAVVIDGTTQPGYAGVPLIELNGAGAGAGASGLILAGGGATVRGLVINRFSGLGIQVQSGNNSIEGCYIGTNAAGTAALSNGSIGVWITNSADNTIGGTTAAARNVISGNGSAGFENVRIEGASSQRNILQGNFIGTNATGTASVSNSIGGVGVWLSGAGNNRVGGSNANARNVISGNNASGIFISGSTAAGNVLQGNYIGTNAAGTAALANNDRGIDIDSAANTIIGGSTSGAGNVISGNVNNGISLRNAGTTGTRIEGNFIGTNAAGDAAVSNRQDGVRLTNAGNNFIGGAAPGARNVISGNGVSGTLGRGIRISTGAGNQILGNYVGVNAAGNAAIPNNYHGASIDSAPNTIIGGTAAGAGNVFSGNGAVGILLCIASNCSGSAVQGNRIGTSADGTIALGNANAGMQIGAGNITVGGTAAGAGNIIANNGLGIRVFLPTTTGVGILSNSIYNNASLGILLFNGANNSQAAPVITAASTSGGVQGTLSGTANTAYTVQLFSNQACDPSGFGEGQTLIGTTTATTDGGGNATFSIASPGSFSGQFITATATAPNNSTSRFSRCRLLDANTVISGQITDAGGQGLGGVTVTLSGAATGAITTDFNGNYSFAVAPGTYTVTPAKINYTFTPPSQTFTTFGPTQVADFGAMPVGSPGGKLVFVSDRDTDFTTAAYEIYSMNADGSNQTRLTNNTARDENPAWSPDGTKIVFTSDRNNFTSEIFVMNADGSNQTRLTNNSVSGSFDDEPAWSPNGSKIAFVRDSNIYVMNADGSNQTQLTNTANDSSPMWSPDVSKLVFVSYRDGNAEIYVMNADGSNQVRITSNTFSDSDPAWSPDGAKITFVRDGNIYVMNANGSNQTQLTNTTSDGNPSWSPDGTQIAFFTFRDPQGDAEIYEMNADGSSQTNISNFPNALDFEPAWQTAAALPPPADLAVSITDAPDPVTAGNNLTYTTAVTNNGPNTATGVRLTSSVPPNVNFIFFSSEFGDTACQENNNTIICDLPDLAPGTTLRATTIVRPILAGTLTSTATVLANVPDSNRANNLTSQSTQVTAANYTISGRVTDVGGGGNGGVTVTLSGAGSQVVQTDGAGNYSFTVAAGGTYTVVANSPYFVFTPQRADFATIASNQTANFTVAAQATPTPTPPLTDDFNGPQRDPTKWNLGTLTQPGGAFDPQVTVAQLNGQLRITPRAGVDGAHYNGYVSTNSYDFTNGQTGVEVVQAATGGANTIFALGQDSNNYYRFITGTGNSLSLTKLSRALSVQDDAPLLVFQVKIGGVITQQAIPYDPVAHRFWRFRHDAPVNALLFETSADNNAFTERYRKSLDKSVSALAVELSAGTAAPSAPGSPAVFDNLALVTSTAQFSAPNYTVAENAGQVSIAITRAGNVNSSPATLVYTTIDNQAAVRCDDRTTLPGVAFARCDYATSVDELRFAAGETTKTLTVPIIDDGFAEGDETFTLQLRDATGASLGAPGRITVTITDNDAAGAPNPIFTTPFFVRQHYLDFLAREPEQGEPWSNILNRCADVNNVDPNNPAAGCDRITVSGAFFGSPEFLAKGVYLIAFYRVAFNRLPEYTEFAPDLRSVTGTTGAETNAKRAAFANSFVLRTEFTSQYGALTNANYVAALLGRYGLTQITTPDPAQPDGPQKVTLTQAELLNRLNASTLTRAQVLRAIVQSDEVSLNREALNAFVAAQYYGFLRRTPDTGGFNSWINYLTTHPGDFRTMVNGFMNSIEYRLRFGVSN